MSTVELEHDMLGALQPDDGLESKLLDAYSGLAIPSGKAMEESDVIFILQGLQALSYSKDIIIEMDGFCGHIYHSCKLTDLENVLQCPLEQCQFRISDDETQISIESKSKHIWDIAIIINTQEARDHLSDYL